MPVEAPPIGEVVPAVEPPLAPVPTVLAGADVLLPPV